MATVGVAANEKIYSVKGWGGLNESPDGDTRLKLGEASKMVNWKVTRDGNLKRRPGTEFVAGLCNEYELQYADRLSELTEVAETDSVITYQNASAILTPGRVVLSGTGSGAVNGVLITETASVRNGVLEFPDEAGAVIEDGVLTISSAPASMTISELREALDELEDGTYLYMWYDELPYALNVNSLYEDGGKLKLGGYLVSSVPVLGENESDRVRGLWAAPVGLQRQGLEPV